MPFFKITQIRSAIGLPSKTRGALLALGLKKRQQTVFHAINADIAGQIMRVKELVAVSEVEKAYTKQELHVMRKPDPGFYIEQRAAEVRRLARNTGSSQAEIL